MNNIKLQPGDIFFTDNFSTASKIVKFLMTAPTLWQHIWRALFGKQEEVRFYHVGMILNETEMIEQQSDVRIRNVDKIFKKNYVIWRRHNLTEQGKNRLVEIALADLGERYGILECIGKTISWLTGIKYFAKWFDMKDRAICAIRVAEWYKGAIGDTFGEADPNYLTTDKMDNYMIDHTYEWSVIDVKYEKL